MAGAYHHIDEYEDAMPTPTNDVEIFRNTKFSQQWDKKVKETVTQTETNYREIINDQILTIEERRPCTLQFPAFNTNLVVKSNDGSNSNNRKHTKVSSVTQVYNNNNNNTKHNNENNNKMKIVSANRKEIEEWKHASQFLKKRINHSTLKLNEKRKFLVGSAMADEYIRLCNLIKDNGGSNLFRLRGGNRPLAKEHLTYGEAQLDSFVKVLQCLDLHPGQRFLDLGSGAGTLVILASLFGCESVGVEVVKHLYETSMVLLDRWEEGKTMDDHESTNKQKKNSSSGRSGNDKSKNSNISRCQFILQDMFNISWRNYDLIYACSTCYGAPMCKRIALKACQEMDRGLILSVSKPLYGLKVVNKMECIFSWGKDTIYVHASQQSSQK
jgi:hypothetical protein